MPKEGEGVVTPTEGDGNEDATVLLSKVKELEASVEKLASDNKGMVEQIIDLRKKKQEAETKAKVVETKPASEIETVVEGILSKKRLGEAEKNKEAAFRHFANSHKDFHPDNDATGTRKELLLKALGRLNTSESFTAEEHVSDLELALEILSRETKSKETSVLDSFASVPAGTGRGKGDSQQAKLSPEQEKLRLEKGWTIEKYLTMRSKYPTIVP